MKPNLLQIVYPDHFPRSSYDTYWEVSLEYESPTEFKTDLDLYRITMQMYTIGIDILDIRHFISYPDFYLSRDSYGLNT